MQPRGGARIGKRANYFLFCFVLFCFLSHTKLFSFNKDIIKVITAGIFVFVLLCFFLSEDQVLSE